MSPPILQASENLQGIPLKRRKSDVSVEIDLNECIICQKDTGEPTCCSAESQKKIIEAARIRKDIVAERLDRIGQKSFVYHVSNNCYKSYTLKKTLAKLEADSSTSEELATDGAESATVRIECPSTRAKIKPRSPPATDSVPVYEKKCTICGNVKHKNERQKFRICEDERAGKFLKAVLFFQGDVYYRTSDLQDVHAVFGADIYCHKNCIRNYLLKYDRANEEQDKQSFHSLREKCFAHLLEEIDFPLKDGNGFTLSELRDHANVHSGTQNTFSNRTMRLFLECHYGSELSISMPTEAN